MVKIYLAGPISEGEDPYAWHRRVRREDDSVNWVNPFLLHDYRDEETRENAQDIIDADLDAVRQSDAILLRRIEGINLSGASIEAREAFVHDIPVVIWNDAESTVPLFLLGHAKSVHNSRSDAIQQSIAAAKGHG